MLSTIRNRKERGFTIIEVLIVLAIAGLILLVVFLAVPALQRNARNTSRREDAGNLLSAVSEYIANNNGSLPGAQTNLGSGTAATLGASGNTVPVSLGYYDAANVSVIAYAASQTTTTDTAKIITGAACSGTGYTTGSARSVVIIFTLEGNGTTGAAQCRQS